MKINSYKKKSNNLYEVTLSNGNKINLFDDVILKYELLLKQDIKEEELNIIINYNSMIEAYNIALKYILSKLRCEKEIKRKLKNYSLEIQDYVINRLTKEGYLSDELYIKSYVNDSVNLKLVGQNKIVFELKSLGFNETDINNYLDTFEDEIWQEKINKYISKKVASNTKDSIFALKNKIKQDLINKGFKISDIDKVMNNFEFVENKDIYQKEYEKLKKKFSNKYSGKELEYYIKMSLLKKGFSHVD